MKTVDWQIVNGLTGKPANQVQMLIFHERPLIIHDVTWYRLAHLEKTILVL